MESITTLLNMLPDYAKDAKLNFSAISNNHALLTEEQFWGVVLASAMTANNNHFTKAIIDSNPTLFSKNLLDAVAAAHSLMSMTNKYYSFIHLVDKPSYASMSANLRMNFMREVPVAKLDFEMYSLAVSIINGCSYCVKAHEKQLLAGGSSEEVVQFIARISAIVNSVAQTLSQVSLLN